MKNPSSYLFVPGNRPDRFDKALGCGADAVILDLEDAVPDAEKEMARVNIEQWLSLGRKALVRVNDAGSEWFQDDLRCCRHENVTGIVLPKAEREADLAHLRQACGDKPVLPLIETARGIANIDRLLRHAGVVRAIFGSIDFQLDLDIQGENEELLFFRSQIVLSSRLAGRQSPVDGAYAQIEDLQGLREASLMGRRLGFGGKLCIHPAQVPVVNQCFKPGPEEIQWALRVVEAAEASGGAAIKVDGRMIDRPVILRAEQILRRSRG
ncbi:MAG TPA: CoA ester lyase [Candidatus Desulfobacillus sp.]|nr:CoA ester lyase [Candidatus Desulfobacillus sp.]